MRANQTYSGTSRTGLECLAGAGPRGCPPPRPAFQPRALVSLSVTSESVNGSTSCSMRSSRILYQDTNNEKDLHEDNNPAPVNVFS